MAAVEVNFLPVDRCGVVIPACRLLPKGLWLTPADQVVQVEHVQIVEGLLAVPASEDVEVVADFVAGVGCTAARRVILGHRGEPSHLQIKFIT